MENDTTPFVNVQKAIPFFMVVDMDSSLDFYVTRLGFEVVKKWEPRGRIEWCWLQREGVSLMLQEPRNKEKTEQQAQNGKGVSICFQCADALKLYDEFKSKRVEIKEPFVGNNMWVVNFSDPDGYRLDFESPTDVPEETTYSEWLKASNI